MKRSRRSLTRCAAQRTLLSNNPLAVLFVALLIAGAVLFLIGSMFVREREARQAQTQPVAETSAEPLVDVATRIDMVERLAMVGQSWCIEQLDKIRNEDPDELVREAADAALMVIASRS